MTTPVFGNAFRCGALLLVLTAAASLRASDDNAPASQVPYFRGLAWTGAAYVGVETDAIQTSANGDVWTVVQPSPKHGIHLVAVGNSRVVVAGDGVLLTATGVGPALTFSERIVPDTKFTQLAFGGGKFVALDAAGRAHVSDSTAAWKITTVATDFEMKGVAFGGGVWVAVGNSGRTGAAIFTSKDPGGVWTHGTIDKDAGPYGIAYGNGRFLVVGYAGLLLTSRDGVAWESTTAPDIASSNDITGVFAAGDNFYVLGEGMFSPTKDGEWLRLPQIDSSYLETPLVRDGKLVVVFQGGDDSRALLPIEEVVRQGVVQMSNWSEGAAEVEPTGFNLVVATPMRITAFDGANVNRLAVSEDTLYAATSKGLFKSSDGQKWERFGGIATAVDFVAATGDLVVIATKDGLSTATGAEGKFTPIANGRFKVRDLRGCDGRFAALGEGTKLLFGTADGWREAALEGVTNILSIEASKDATCTIFADTAAGLRQFYVDAAETRSSWTPLRGLKSARLIYNTFVLLDRASGATFGSIAENGIAQHVDLPGRVTELADSTDSGFWIVTSRGLVAGVSDEKLWKLHVADGAALTTIVDAGSSVVAGGQGGVIVIVPKPAEGAPELVALASKPINLMPTDLKFPAGVRLQVLGEHRGRSIQRLKTDGGKIYGVLGSDCFSWSVQGWSYLELPYSVRSGLRDFVAVDGQIAVISATTVTQTSAGGANGASTSWDFAIAGQTADFRRIFHANGTYLVLSGRNGVGSASYLGSLTPRAIGGDVEFRDAAWGNGAWVLVGAQGDGGNAPAIFAGADRSSLVPVRTPVNSGALHAVIFDGKRFIAVGDRGHVVTSANGVDWTARQIDGAPGLREIAFGAGQYGVATEAGAILVSDDLASWRELPRDPQFVFQHVAGTAETLWAIGENVALASTAPASAWNDRPLIASIEVRVVTPVAVVATVPAVAPAATNTAAENFTRATVEWDAGMTAAKTADERQQFCNTFIREWSYAHPNHTQDEALALVNDVYTRVLTYETNDHVISSFILGPSMFSNDFTKAFIASQDPAQRVLIKQVFDDVVADYEAKWKPDAPGHPARVQAHATPAQPPKGPAEMDIDALRLRAARGDKVAAYDLNYAYRVGEGVPLDIAAANYWLTCAKRAGFVTPTGSFNTPEETFVAYRLLADQGSANFQYRIGLACRDGVGTATNNAEAVRWFQRAIAGGHWGAGLELASIYRWGKGIKMDLVASLRLLEQTAALGHARSTAEIGWTYEVACGVPRDLARAAVHYQKAIDLGNSWAVPRLANLYLVGQGLAKDDVRARAILQRAADAGDDAAKTALADLATGKFVPRLLAVFVPPHKAPAIFDVAARRAKAEAGDPAACYDLAYACWNNTGIEPADNLGDEWLAKAKATGLKYANQWDTPEEATATWKELADQGSIVALNALGQRHRDGTGTLVDHTAANAAFQLAIAGGNWEAYVELAAQHRYGRGVKADPTAALKLLEQGAALSHARSIAELGWTYEAACGVKRDLAKAAQYYQRAADLDQTWAMRRLADCYLAGQGVAKDEPMAKTLLEKASNLGDLNAGPVLAQLADKKYTPRALATYTLPKPLRPIFDVATRRAQAAAGEAAACYDMAYITWKGFGVEADNNAGNQWLAKAKAKGWKDPEKWDTPENVTASWRALADQGSLVGMDTFARRLKRGEGVAADPADSTARFLKAADAGHFDAQAEVGLIYEYGRGTIAIDDANAIEWYRRAADGGNAFAQVNMGYRYATGRGVTRDDSNAVRYYKFAAEGGNETAAANLAQLLTAGSGAPADPKAAAGWYLELAGLPNEPTEPAAAYAQIKDAIAAGTLDGLGALAIMTKHGFGTTANVNEAWALAYASEEFETAIFPFNWFNDDTLVKPTALRRSARIIRNGWKSTMAELYEKLFAEGRQADTSEIAGALRALEAGTVTDEQIAAVSKSVEPLRIYGLATLSQKAQTEKSPAGQPWALRLAGLAEKPADAPAAENAFVSAALYTPDEDDGDAVERIIALRAIQVARLFYGIGTKADGPTALAWALLNEEATDSFLPIAFLAEPLSSEELARADARYLGLVAQQHRQLADIINLGNDADARTDAMRLYRTAVEHAADAGDLPSLLKVAGHYETDDYNFGHDPAAAFTARLKAARLGDVESMFRAGFALVNGTDTTANETEGKAWLEKAATAGHAGAKAALADLTTAAARAALRTPPDKKSGPVNVVVFKALTDLQNDTTTKTLGEPAIVALLKAVWWDADYSSVDEDLARELKDSTARPLVVTSATGATLTFTKTVDASVAVVFPQYLQGEFNVLNGEYYKQVWLKTVIAGVFLGGCHANDNGRTFMRQCMAEVIFDGVKFAAGQGGASYEQIFGALKTAHDTANPALQAEFRAEIDAAIALVEAAGHTLPPAWKNAAWLQGATAAP